MLSLKRYIYEENSVDTLLHKLHSYGYDKVNMLQKNTVGVYVPKSDREIVLQDLSTKLNTPITMPISGLKSSIGALEINNGPFAGLKLFVKPDASKNLNTDQQESLHAYYIATIFNKPNTEFSTDDVIQYGQKDVRSKYSAKELIEIASAGWIKSAILIAQTIYSKYAGNKYLVVQRSKSKFVDNISQAFKILNNKNAVSINQDKWNPADIWCVDPSLISFDFSKFSTLDELNDWILEKFNTKDLLPISLKQTKKNPKFEIKNLERKNKTIIFSNYDLGKVSYTNSLDMNVYYNKDNIIQFRNFGRPENIAGEISGKGAAAGKIGFSIIDQFFKKYTKRYIKILHSKDIAKQYTINPDKFLSELYNQAIKLDSRLKSTSLSDFIKEIKSKKNELTYIISKYQVTQLAQMLDSMNNMTKNKLIGDIISYAGSELDSSSVYIKVSEG